MKWSIIVLCLLAYGCTSEPKQISIAALKQRLTPKRIVLPSSKSPVELAEEEISSRKTEHLQLKNEIQILRDKIENNARKINTYKMATKREKRDCPRACK